MTRSFLSTSGFSFFFLAVAEALRSEEKVVYNTAKITRHKQISEPDHPRPWHPGWWTSWLAVGLALA